MKTILFSFKTTQERDSFMEALKQSGNETIESALMSIRLDPSMRAENERSAALWVSGTKIMEGPLDQIERMFKQECASHHAKVEIRELKNGEWQRIKIRTVA